MSASNRDPDEESKIVNPAAQDQADLIRSSSIESLSSGGDSDGGPEEPNPAEISLLSASLDCRNVEVSREPMETLAVSETEAIVEVEVLPAGYHRLPSAMRPPVRRGHMRSASAGGNVLNNIKGQNLLQRNSSAASETSTKATSVASSSAVSNANASSATSTNNSSATSQKQPLPSVLKSSAHRSHRR